MKHIGIILGNLESSARHMHNDMECLLVIKGSIDVEINGNEYTLNEDDIIILNPRDVHSIKGNETNIVLFLKVEKQYLEKECKEVSRSVINCNSSTASESDEKKYRELKRILTKMLLVRSEKREGYNLEFTSLFFKFMQYLYIHFRNNEKTVISETDENDVMNKALNFINNNYDKNITLDNLAQRVFMSPQYFSKYFKQKTGVGFLEYLSKVRLEHAISDLIFTDDSIIKIAMNNGFANAKSFTANFQKEYHETPSTYRKRYSQSQTEGGGELRSHEFNLELEDGLMEFLRYLRKHDMSTGGLDETKEVVAADISGGTGAALVKPLKIIDISTLEALAKHETIELLELVQSKLRFQYVYFLAFSKVSNQSYPKNDILRYYQEYQAFEKIYQLGLVPFFKIDYSLIKRHILADMDIEAYYDYVMGVVTYIQEKMPKLYMNDWKFELMYSEEEDAQEFPEFYGEFYRRLSDVMNSAQVGICAFVKRRRSGFRLFEDFLHEISSSDLKPAFITFYSFPEEDIAYISQDAYEQLADYHLQLISQIRAVMERRNYSDLPLYMPSWNTLCGMNSAQTGTFFRSALIIELLLSISGTVKGIGFPLNTYEPSLMSAQSNTNTLGLFLYFRVKRPVYFMITVFNLLGEKILYHDNALIITQNREGEFIIVIYNPQYINPIYTIDPLYMKQSKRQVTLKLDGLESGRYRVKRRIYDNGSAGVFSHWVNVGYPDFLDEDVIDYMEHAIVPDLTVIEEEITDTYILHSKLDFNSVVLYKLNKI